MQKIVLIHGLAGSKNNFRYLEEELKSDFEVISFDLLGHGEEEKPKEKYDPQTFVSFIEKKIRFNSMERYVLVGHSMGGILAKEFAMKHPHNVQKIFLINYPGNMKKVLAHWFYRLYVHDSPLAKLLCHTKVIWKYLIYPFFFFYDRKYFWSFKDYFRHTYYSETHTLRNTLLADDWKTLHNLKKKVVLIVGEHDQGMEWPIVNLFKHYIIKRMGHSFFHYEQEIAKIIIQDWNK